MMYTLVEKPCKWCQGTGDWNIKNPNLEEPGSCEICDGTGSVQDIPTDVPDEHLKDCGLSDEEVHMFAEFWCSGRRDENLGEYIKKIAAYIKMKDLQKTRRIVAYMEQSVLTNT